jgi:LacI family repressor for deo operon, udp, cdd, tsx, nupC, and nupG
MKIEKNETFEPEQPAGASRLADIARKTGLSIATVSRALMGSSRVAEPTRRRVEAAAELLGYMPNQLARSLRTQRTYLIVVMVPDIGNTFFSYVLAGIEEEAQRRGYSVLIGNVAGDPRRAKSYGDRLLAGAADGTILINGKLPEENWAARMEAMSLPVVALCERIEGKNLSTVAIDDRGSARSVTEHLIATGHRRIGHIGGPPGNVLSRDRLAGYRDALEAAGITFDPDFVTDGDFTIGGGVKGYRQLLSRNPQLTALFCANDETAMGAINCARDGGKRIPEDMAVAGFDGLEFGAAFFPPLTTVVQPRVELGTNAMRLLHEQIENPRCERRTVILKAEPVIRASTMPAGR